MSPPYQTDINLQPVSGCNVIITGNVNMCNNTISNVATLSNSGNISLQPSSGCNVLISGNIDMCNNAISNITTLSNSAGTIALSPGTSYSIVGTRPLDLCNNNISNVTSFSGRTVLSLTASLSLYDNSTSGILLSNGAGDMIRLGDAAGGTGISLSLGAGASLNSMSINGNPMVNQQGIVTIYAFSIVSTISDTNITTASIILVTPYGDISRGGSVTNSFWVTLNSGTSWDINIGANLPSDIDFSYHILKY